MSPTVSILVPSYNHAAFLERCIGSVLAQSFTDWELMAQDDCSQDESVSILRGFADPRVSVDVNRQNLGTYGTLAEALKRARGEFVAVLNSDDKWAPNKLQKQVLLMQGRPELSVCYTLGWRVDDSDVPDFTTDDTAGWPNDEIQQPLPFLVAENRILASSVVFRRSVVRFRPELRYSGDWVALLEAALKAPFGLVPERLTFWRMHGNNSFRRSAPQVNEEVWVRESILAFGSQWGVHAGLSTCAVHLSALYLLQGRKSDARQAALLAVRLAPNRASLRRFGAVLLGTDLWPGVEKVPPGETKPPIQFGRS